jgi:hypothetical protein
VTSSTAPTAPRPTIGALLSVRGQQWVVSDLEPAEHTTVVALQSVDRLGDTVEVVWEVEPGRRVLPAGSLPDVATDGFDPPERLAAFPGRSALDGVTATVSSPATSPPTLTSPPTRSSPANLPSSAGTAPTAAQPADSAEIG